MTNPTGNHPGQAVVWQVEALGERLRASPDSHASVLIGMMVRRLGAIFASEMTPEAQAIVADFADALPDMSRPVLAALLRRIRTASPPAGYGSFEIPCESVLNLLRAIVRWKKDDAGFGRFPVNYQAVLLDAAICVAIAEEGKDTAEVSFMVDRPRLARAQELMSTHPSFLREYGILETVTAAAGQVGDLLPRADEWDAPDIVQTHHAALAQARGAQATDH